jgi:hypothetical protein
MNRTVDGEPVGKPRAGIGDDDTATGGCQLAMRLACRIGRLENNYARRRMTQKLLPTVK